MHDIYRLLRGWWLPHPKEPADRWPANPRTADEVVEDMRALVASRPVRFYSPEKVKVVVAGREFTGFVNVQFAHPRKPLPPELMADYTKLLS